MIKVLVIHSTELTYNAYKKKLYKEYTFLITHEEMYRVYVANITKKVKSSPKKFDRFYYDEETVNAKDIWEKFGHRLASTGNPQIYPITFGKKKMKTKFISPIKQK